MLVVWLWFLIMLVPMLGLVGSFLQARADNYTYLSQIGLSMAVAWGVWSVAAPVRWRSVTRWGLELVAAGSMLALAACAWRQATYWHDSEAVWTAPLPVPSKMRWHTRCLARCTGSRGDSRGDRAAPRVLGERFDQSLRDCRGPLPAWRLPHRAREARRGADAFRGGAKDPADAERFHFLLASAYGQTGRLDKALPKWRETVPLFPASVVARFRLAESLFLAGENAESVEQCREALKLEPDAARVMVIWARR